MRLDVARRAWARASREMARLAADAEGTDEHAFEDRLPYVLDLLDGVSRQVNDYKPRTAAFAVWWRDQWTADRLAVRELRIAQLKKLEDRQRRRVYTQTNSSAGTFMGKPINAGDTVTWWRWHLVGGHFDGQDALNVLYEQLANLERVIEEAEALLSRGA